MKNALKLAFLAASLTVVSFSVSATQLIINNGECVLELAAGQAVSIDPASGDVRATVTNLEECMGTLEPPVINSFTRSPSGDLAPGASVTLSWNTEHADSCTAGGTLPGWSGSKAVQGSQTVQVSNVGTYSATLTCANSVDTASKSLSIRVVEGNGPVTCPNRPAPQGLTRAARSIWGSHASNHGHFWNGTFIGNFPGSTNARNYYQEPGQYHAIEFNTGNLPANMRGQVNGGEPQGSWASSVAPGERIVSISQCRGDFHPQPDNPGCLRKLRGTDSIQWGGTNTGSVFRCALEPNTRYYLNIVYTNSAVGDPNPTWHCSGNKPNCGAVTWSTHDSSPNWP